MAMLSETSEREAPVFLGRGLDLLKYADSFAEIGAVIHSDFVDVTDQAMDALGLRKLEKPRPRRPSGQPGHRPRRLPTDGGLSR